MWFPGHGLSTATARLMRLPKILVDAYPSCSILYPISRLQICFENLGDATTRKSFAKSVVLSLFLFSFLLFNSCWLKVSITVSTETGSKAICFVNEKMSLEVNQKKVIYSLFYFHWHHSQLKKVMREQFSNSLKLYLFSHLLKCRRDRQTLFIRNTKTMWN